MALFPQHLIGEGLAHIEKLAMELGKKQDEKAEEQAIKNGIRYLKRKTNLVMWKMMFEYIHKTWVKRFETSFFCVLGSTDRTNNVLERLHRDYNDYLGGRPGVNQFLSKSTMSANFQIIFLYLFIL